MKTIYTLSTLILLALALNTQADDKVKSKHRSAAVSAAPFSLGDPDTEVPLWLGHVKAKNALVPVAPFEWGSPEEAERISELRLIVPVAPFAYGEPDTDVPFGLQYVKAVNADVPLAPFEFGEPEAEAPQIVSIAR
jgi:hypothetical protein